MCVEELGFNTEQRVNGATANTPRMMRNCAMTDSEWKHGLAENDGKEALARVRATLVRALEEVDLYNGKFEAADEPRRKAEVLNWTLHYLATGIAPNLRLDMLANAQARLASLADH